VSVALAGKSDEKGLFKKTEDPVLRPSGPEQQRLIGLKPKTLLKPKKLLV
jgi:hypothetical protein